MMLNPVSQVDSLTRISVLNFVFVLCITRSPPPKTLVIAIKKMGI
ncbi:hypothetical protein Pan161_31490 [Gimesia algae]|uniref:Uncharacterized protein n=1 Tax=Gimesia algae TaxID=2527971 RepID=A0A517VEQ1_9PLAN|nr:hypothetical protein Pan161_31490 [Gimesia algae]